MVLTLAHLESLQPSNRIPSSKLNIEKTQLPRQREPYNSYAETIKLTIIARLPYEALFM